MARFVRVASVADIPVGTMKGLAPGHSRLVVARTKEGFFAVVDECSHDSAPISDGELCGNEIMCARHGARFDLMTGNVTAPPAVVPIDTIEVKVEGDNVFVLLED